MEALKSSGDGECSFKTTMAKKKNEGRADIIVVGAGVAGSALAYALGKDGWLVHVFERDLAEPDRIVGELLQPGGYSKLIELGLEDCVEDIDAQRVAGIVFLMKGKRTRMSYPPENIHSDMVGRGFRNGRFIQKMREKAASLPNVRLEQGTVVSLIEEKGTIKGVRYKPNTGQELTALAPLTIVCDGGFSNLRRSLCNPKVDVPSCAVCMVLENCELPFTNHGHVVMADPSLVLMFPISSTEIRCMVDVLGQKVPSISSGEMAHYLKTKIAPQMPPELYCAFMSAVDKGNIRTMPNRIMAADPYPTPGALLLGDAFNMRHSLTGGGMTVALSDVVLLRNLLRPVQDLHDSYALCKYLESFHTLRKPMASTMNILADSMHTVFSASPHKARQEIRNALLDFLGLGSMFTNQALSLYSGLSPRPLSLLLFFFAMAVYGVGRLLLPFPSRERLWLAAGLISEATAIVFPIVKAEGVRQMFFPVTVPAYHRAPPERK